MFGVQFGKYSRRFAEDSLLLNADIANLSKMKRISFAM